MSESSHATLATFVERLKREIDRLRTESAEKDGLITQLRKELTDAKLALAARP